MLSSFAVTTTHATGSYWLVFYWLQVEKKESVGDGLIDNQGVIITAAEPLFLIGWSTHH
jgi:hypothetical protein